MPEKSYALEAGGPERLGLAWSGGFKQLTITFDGQLVASFESAREIAAAQTVDLPDGSRLEVQLTRALGIPELLLRRDGEPIPGSAADPTTRHAAAWGMVAVVAGLNVGLGLLVELLDVDVLRAIGVGWPSVLSGHVYAVLAFFVRRRSQLALGLAVGLFALDGMFMLLRAGQAGTPPPVGGIVARVFFFIPMLRGFAAIRELERPRPRRVAQRRAPAAGGRTAQPAAATPRPAQPPATTPAARTLTGDAERRRLQLASVAAPALPPTAARNPRKSISLRSSVGVDEAAAALRFVARRCEITPGGLRVQGSDGRAREVVWADVARVVVRALPPDPPWEGALLLDLVAPLAERWQPVRVFSSTIVNYGALPGGAASARLENLRRLAAHVRERNPAVEVDEDTLRFLGGGPAPRFVDLTSFSEYDSAYGS